MQHYDVAARITQALRNPQQAIREPKIPEPDQPTCLHCGWPSTVYGDDRQRSRPICAQCYLEGKR